METEARLARELAGVAGACFGLMGAAMAGRARRHAQDNASWQRQWRQATGAEPAAGDGERETRRLTLVYRIAGAAFASAGLALLGAAALRPEALAAWQRPPSIGRGGALAGGLLLSAAGFALAYAKTMGVERPAQALGSPGKEPLGERFASGCGWALSFLLSGYGLRLLKEALR